MELSSKGNTQMEIAEIMQISQAQVHYDMQHCKEQAKEVMRRYLDQFLPEEFFKCLISVENALKAAWNVVEESSKDNTAEGKKIRLAAINQVNQCLALKAELLSNLGVVEDAMGFVEKNSTKSKVAGNNHNLQQQDAKNQEEYPPPHENYNQRLQKQDDGNIIV
jgi:hypothetical protein